MNLNLRSAIDGFISRNKISLLIDTTNGCNLKCVFCTRKSGRVVRMKTEEFGLILRKIHKHVNRMQLSCAWEYSIAENAPELLKTLGRFKIPYTSIYTNGNILTDDIAIALIDARINDFVISIGEARQETYEKLRRGGKFKRVISNINKLNRLKKERKSGLPRICSNLTVINSNIDELVVFVELAHSIGIERIIGRHLILNKGLDMDSEKVRDKAHVNHILHIAEEKAAGFGMGFSIPRYGNDTLKPKECRAPWNQLYISSNGNVSVCPRIHVYERVGNLITDSLDSILDGLAMHDLKKQFDDRSFRNPVCELCMDNLETEVEIDQGF